MRITLILVCMLMGNIVLQAQLAGADDDYRTERVRYLVSELDLDDATAAELLRRFKKIKPNHSAANWKDTRLAYEKVLSEVLNINQLRRLSTSHGYENECIVKRISFRTSDDNRINTRPNLMHLSPNPASDQTTISYEVGVAGQISLMLNDELGNHVKTLVNKHHDAGNYEHILETIDLQSNLYLVVMRDGKTVITKKLIVQK